MVEFYEECADGLTVHVRYIAWLNAVPDEPPKKVATPNIPADTRTRRERFRDDRIDVEFPECDALHLVDYLWEIGPTMSMGMGAAPLTQSEIAAWQANTGIDLSAWEARTIRRLSSEFLYELQAATDRLRRPPWPPEPTVDMRASIAAKVRNVLRDD